MDNAVGPNLQPSRCSNHVRNTKNCTKKTDKCYNAETIRGLLKFLLNADSETRKAKLGQSETGIHKVSTTTLALIQIYCPEMRESTVLHLPNKGCKENNSQVTLEGIFTHLTES